MKTEVLEFVGFKGKSKLSQAIRRYTRGHYSHIAIRLNESAADYLRTHNAVVSAGTLIEQWPHGSNPIKAYMDYSDFTKHSEGTPYDVWGLSVSVAEFWFCLCDWNRRAIIKEGYDYKGLFGFLTKSNDSENHTFCSEVAILPMVKFRQCTHTNPGVIHPSMFISHIQFAGGVLLESGIV